MASSERKVSLDKRGKKRHSPPAKTVSEVDEGVKRERAATQQDVWQQWLSPRPHKLKPCCALAWKHMASPAFAAHGAAAWLHCSRISPFRRYAEWSTLQVCDGRICILSLCHEVILFPSLRLWKRLKRGEQTPGVPGKGQKVHLIERPA